MITTATAHRAALNAAAAARGYGSSASVPSRSAAARQALSYGSGFGASAAPRAAPGARPRAARVRSRRPRRTVDGSGRTIGPVQVRPVDDAAEFLRRAGPLLLADEARHNLMLGIAGTIARPSRARTREQRLWLVDRRRGGRGRSAADAAVQPRRRGRRGRARGARPPELDEQLPGVGGRRPRGRDVRAARGKLGGASIAEVIDGAGDLRPRGARSSLRGRRSARAAATETDRRAPLAWLERLRPRGAARRLARRRAARAA